MCESPPGTLGNSQPLTPPQISKSEAREKDAGGMGTCLTRGGVLAGEE